MISTEVTPGAYTDYTAQGRRVEVPYWSIKVFERKEMLGFNIVWAPPTQDDVKDSIDWVLQQNRIQFVKNHAQSY